MGMKAFFVGLVLTVMGASSFLVNSGSLEVPTLIKMVFESMGSFWSLMLTIVGILVILYGSRMHSKKSN